MGRIQYFLGGNTPAGFYSLYDELTDPCKVNFLYILKGGAGCGKSTLMKRVARHGEAAGLDTEYILCSGDPDSLDAVRFPELGIAIVDGTSPHVTEAAYAGVVERYVDLSRFYDRTALRPLREDIIAATGEYKSHYKQAYRCLNAAGQLHRSLRENADTPEVRDRLNKRAQGIITREIKPISASKESVSRRFLTALTHRGPVALWDTVTAQADRIYRLSDSYGLSHYLLAPILSAAVSRDLAVIACPDPMDPDRLAHLILPGLRLAFVTDKPDMPWDEKSFRHLRLDPMAESDTLKAALPRLKFSRKVAGALAEEGVASLRQAKESHDRLEALYNPHVDFQGVLDTADTLAEQIIASR